jgi:hypothetical protein
VSLLGKREPESSGKDRGKLALRPDTVVASTNSVATNTIRHAVSDRQSTNPAQARLDATVYFPSNYHIQAVFSRPRAARQLADDRQRGATTGASKHI